MPTLQKDTIPTPARAPPKASPRKATIPTPAQVTPKASARASSAPTSQTLQTDATPRYTALQIDLLKLVNESETLQTKVPKDVRERIKNTDIERRKEIAGLVAAPIKERWLSSTNRRMLQINGDLDDRNKDFGKDLLPSMVSASLACSLGAKLDISSEAQLLLKDLVNFTEPRDRRIIPLVHFCTGSDPFAMARDLLIQLLRRVPRDKLLQIASELPVKSMEENMEWTRIIDYGCRFVEQYFEAIGRIMGLLTSHDCVRIIIDGPEHFDRFTKENPSIAPTRPNWKRMHKLVFDKLRLLALEQAQDRPQGATIQLLFVCAKKSIVSDRPQFVVDPKDSVDVHLNGREIEYAPGLGPRRR